MVKKRRCRDQCRTAHPSAARLAAGCIATLLLAATIAFGQAPESAAKPSPPTAKTHPNDPTVWNIDQMMEDALLQISRRYNLNKAQESFTRLLLRGRVLDFLDLYEDDVRQLLKESIELKLGFKEDTPEVRAEWARRAAPVYEAAKNAILDGNMEWGEILTGDQKTLHDRDLTEMDRNFGQVTRLIEGWKQGKGPRLGPGTRKTTATVRKDVREITSQPAIIKIRLTEANWLLYVEKFIETYNLDEKQQNSVKAKIHKDTIAQARAYRERQKDELAKIEAELKQLEGNSEKVKSRRKALHQRKTRLEEPVRRMFIAMNRRLYAVPRAAQLASAEPGKKKILDQMYKRLASAKKAGKTTTRPATAKTRTFPPKAATTRPAQRTPAKATPPQPKSPAKPPAQKPKADAPAQSSHATGRDQPPTKTSP